MTMCRRERVMVAVHVAGPPTDEEWSRWVALGRDEPGALRALVESYGGGPDAKQRKELANALGQRDLRSAILTDSLLVRGVVTALAWLGISLRAFARDQHDAAARYLELTPEEQSWALEMLSKLRRDSGLTAQAS